MRGIVGKPKSTGKEETWTYIYPIILIGLSLTLALIIK